jgi:hypothetical protein
MINGTSKNIIFSVADVHRYLKAYAWKISKTQLYEHVEQKKLKREDDGNFSIPIIDKYALKYLRRADGSKPSKALADIQARKYEADVRQSMASAEIKEIKISVLKGEYVRKDAFELALAERAMLFKQDIETFCRSKAAEIVNLIGGDKEKIPDLIDYLLNETANWLDCYSRDREFILPMPALSGSEDHLVVGDDDDEDEADLLK